MKQHGRYYTSSDKINNARTYSQFLQIGFDDGWSKNDKWDNFDILLESTGLTSSSIEGASILDVGCGTGDLIQFLSDKGIREYKGIDIFEPAIEKAREKFPKSKFIVGDFLTHKFRRKFDFVFCSGALTTRLESDNYEMLNSWIPRMWSLSKKGVCFNFLLGDNDGVNSLFLYDSKRVIEICQRYIPEAAISTKTTDAGGGNNFQEMHVFLY